MVATIMLQGNAPWHMCRLVTVDNRRRSGGMGQASDATDYRVQRLSCHCPRMVDHPVALGGPPAQRSWAV